MNLLIKPLITPPDKIARYRIDGIIGSGAMGVVYQGFDTQIQRKVAVKVLHPHLQQGDQGAELIRRFLQEARAAARCLHSNIVTIFDFGSEQDSPYIVMECVDGIELKAHLKSDTLIPLPSATDICIQVLEALNYAHEKGVVHRDIKPANIIMLENGMVKVSDFGVARLDTSDLTSTGYMVGTPNYMSPEGLQGHTVDARSDLYSVGVLYFELLTRQLPQRDVSLDQTLMKLNSADHLSGQNVRSIQNILRRALQSDPNARFQNAAEFIAQLKGIEDMDLTQANTTLFQKPQGYKPQMPASAMGDSSSASQWNNEMLESLENSLAKYIGPMARLLVRKQSRSATSIDELVSNLTHHIPNELERSQFIRALERTGVSKPGLSMVTPATPASDVPTQIARELLNDKAKERITQLLAFHVGPLAGRIIQQAMKTTLEPNILILQLAQLIQDDKDRQKFIDQASKLI
jgi:serine/threonine-protein kinase